MDLYSELRAFKNSFWAHPLPDCLVSSASGTWALAVFLAQNGLKSNSLSKTPGYTPCSPLLIYVSSLALVLVPPSFLNKITHLLSFCLCLVLSLWLSCHPRFLNKITHLQKIVPLWLPQVDSTRVCVCILLFL
jgi:hypothetical protein